MTKSNNSNTASRTAIRPAAARPPIDTFARRHLGPRAGDVDEMLELLGYASLDKLCEAAVPKAIQLEEPRTLEHLPSNPHGEFELLESLKRMMSKSRRSSWRS